MVENSWVQPHIILALLFLVFQGSTANLFASRLTTTINSAWNPPIRIGVQGSSSSTSIQAQRKSRKPRRFGSLLARSQTSQVANAKHESLVPRSAAVDAVADVANAANGNDSEDLFNEEEWNALFPSEPDITRHAARATTTAIHGSRSSLSASRTALFEETRGFRNTLNLPALLLRSKKDEELTCSEYKVAKVVTPCAAVAVSSKINTKQASFSSQSLTDRARESTLHRRKEASRHNNNQQSTSSTSSSAAAKATTGRPLVFWENMVCGAISRSVAQTTMHPANTMKTILQQSNAPPLASFFHPSKLPILFRGAGANFVLSIPHGAVNFAVLEMVRKELSRGVQRSKYLSEREDRIGPALDFLSSAISTICCSVVSTPQMMITDNIMAGNYKNLPDAVRGLASQGKGLQGFYASGWLPGLVGKIPSYALTWTFFQQLKVAQQKFSGREATNIENTIMGCIASGTCVCIMIPMDTIKTRLVTQASSAAIKSGGVPYKGIIDCAIRVAREEGASAFYRGLPPRLISVVPMIGIQFTAYEFMKRVMQKRAMAASAAKPKAPQQLQLPRSSRGKKGTVVDDDEAPAFDPYSSLHILEEAAMEVAASPEHPYPAPHFLEILIKKNNDTEEKKKKKQ